MVNENQHLTMMAVEVVFQARDGLKPNPRIDSIAGLVYAISDDDVQSLYRKDPERAAAGNVSRVVRGLIWVGNPGSGIDARDPRGYGLDKSVRVRKVQSEQALFETLVRVVRQVDPDVLTGYEVQADSLGLLIERAGILKMDLCRLLGRCGGSGANYFDPGSGRDSYGLSHNSGIHVSGRIVLNLWRLARGELALRSYSYVSVVRSVLHVQVPVYTPWQVWRWWRRGGRVRVGVIEHVLLRACHVLEIFGRLNLVERTSEQARVFGIDFFSVLSRGSQFRVESMMLRLTKPCNYVLVSPSPEQVSEMAAAEAVPLILEPVSRLYSDPVIVLDFASLYPSVMIAYNLCFSTILGRVSEGEAQKLGVSKAHVLPHTLLADLASHSGLHAAPNGVLFVTPEVRPGVLPKMLSELLETRAMVKKALKKARREGKAMLARMLDARQESLKLIANVTYGYTTASFSGRMPCIELADAIVQTGREILERAIRTIEGNPEWGARVVYGDTDSVFVLVEGVSKARAFEVGREISEVVTRQNRAPIRLKLEKVYLPCALLTKKRYVGYAYEDEEQEAPDFDAKGIETVRRDSAPVTARILEATLRQVFESKDLSEIKAMLEREWGAIHRGEVPFREFVFGKEVRLGKYAVGRVPPPVALVAQRRMRKDPRAEPRYKERIPYVVVYGAPEAKLYEQVVDPMDLLEDGNLGINAKYYCVNNVNAALDRVLSQVGVDVGSWYSGSSRIHRRVRGRESETISAFFASRACPGCLVNDVVGGEGLLCSECGKDVVGARARVMGRGKVEDRERAGLERVCLGCVGVVGREGVEACVGVECGVRWQRAQRTSERSERVSVVKCRE